MIEFLFSFLVIVSTISAICLFVIGVWTDKEYRKAKKMAQEDIQRIRKFLDAQKQGKVT